jgi:hypothetical protein
VPTIVGTADARAQLALIVENSSRVIYKIFKTPPS